MVEVCIQVNDFLEGPEIVDQDVTEGVIWLTCQGMEQKYFGLGSSD